MSTRNSIKIGVLLSDMNIGPDGDFVPPGQVQRRATFTISVDGQRDEAVLDAVFAGCQGQPLRVREVIQDDLPLPGERARELAQAIYEGHYGIADHEHPTRQSHLTGEMNVEPYWEAIVLEKFSPAI